MKKLIFFLFLICGFGVGAFGQESTLQKVPLSQAEIDKILAKVALNETHFRQALTNYNFSRSATIQTVGIGGNITGTYRRDSDMNITPEGTRLEKITFFPVDTLTEVSITPQDLEDLGGVNPFAIEPDSVPKYNFTYMGKDHIDELNLWVFDVAPKVMPDPKKINDRMFQGRIWVDVDDLTIVKSKGKGVPETKNNKYPIIETYRENIDGKYWFPAFASSDDEVVFGSGQVVKFRVRIKFNAYKLGHTDVRIIGEDEAVPDASPSPTPTPKKP
ncbi:MAG: hypothetical protein ABI999_13970 [Acidobacteriota bacterium]